jgi:hypothetical protein
MAEEVVVVAVAEAGDAEEVVEAAAVEAAVAEAGEVEAVAAVVRPTNFSFLFPPSLSGQQVLDPYFIYMRCVHASTDMRTQLTKIDSHRRWWWWWLG